jgi:peptidoglycan hydrolase-like protein with peptidoglycan-binding domain
MSNLINEELNTMKYLFGYQKGKVISEQTTPVAPATTAAPSAPSAATAPDVIKKIQEVLNTKYGAKLTVDGKWGPMTQSAFESTINQLKK